MRCAAVARCMQQKTSGGAHEGPRGVRRKGGLGQDVKGGRREGDGRESGLHACRLWWKSGERGRSGERKREREERERERESERSRREGAGGGERRRGWDLDFVELVHLELQSVHPRVVQLDLRPAPFTSR
eukprot:1849440-Rhodomonas_salina.1